MSAFLKDAFDEAVKFFGENAKTTPPSVFFPVFVRFVKAYRVSWFTSRVLLQRFLFAFFLNLFPSVPPPPDRISLCTAAHPSRIIPAFWVCYFKHACVSSQQAEEDNEQRKRQEQILMEKLLEQEAMLEENQKVSVYLCMSTQLRPS